MGKARNEPSSRVTQGSTVALGRTFRSESEKVATEATNKRVAELLERILGRLENPVPVPLMWN